MSDELQLAPGQLFSRRYLLEQLIGRGGMGTVWRARDQRSKADVALKIITPRGKDGKPSATAVGRFTREARAMARLRSPHVVRVLDHGADGPLAYIAMELLKGVSLHRALKNDGALSIEQTLRMMTHVGRAVAVAHQRGIVHRDLKPGNILVTADGEPKLLDFGVAKLSKDQGQPITKVGTLVGTPDYMSPEATFGLELDGRADVYALGIVLYEMLTGVLPFQGDSLLEVLELHREALPESARTTAPEAMIPEALDALLLRCLSKKPEDRPGSVDQVQAELASLRAPQTTPTTVPITATATDAYSEEAEYAEPLAPAESLLSRALPTIAGVLLLAVAASALFLWSRPKKPVKRAAAPIEIPTKKAPEPLRLPEVQLAPKTVAPPPEAEAKKPPEVREAPEAPKPEEKAPPKARKRRRKRRRSKASPSRSAPKRKTAPVAPPVDRKAVKPPPTAVKPANTSKGKPIEKSGINRSDTLNPFQEKK